MNLDTHSAPTHTISAPTTLTAVRRVIPRNLFERDDRKAWSFLSRNLLGLVLCQLTALLAWTHSLWWLYPLCWLVAGTFLFGLFEVAHNCGHHAFFSSKRTNKVVGHLAALPLLYPFTQWKLWHDAHHRRPNSTAQTLREQFQGNMSLKLDTAFSPLNVQDALTAQHKGGLSWLVYRVSRRLVPIAVFLAPLLLTILFARRLRHQEQRDCRISLLFSCGVTLPLMASIVILSHSWFALVHFWLAPLAVYASWLGCYSFLQHTGEDIPVYDDHEWTNLAQIHAVVNTTIPTWLSWIHGGGEFHAIHHIAPTLPSYHLAAAHQALQNSPYAPLIRSVPLSLKSFWKLQRTCEVWDASTSAYRSISSLKSVE